MTRSALRDFLRTEAGSGALLVAAAALAMAVANTGLSGAYETLRHFPLAGMSLLHWVNDGLMALFFLVVALEVKRELLDGQLSTWERRLLPGVAAAAGMALPALVYLAISGGTPELARGWAIPTATDIAFALGVLAMVGKRVPVSLKVFLTAVAVLDDLGAIAIIAVFYTGDLAIGPLLAAVAVVLTLVMLNRLRVLRIAPYLLLGAALWWLVLQSGIHATLAGVAVGLCVPLRPTPGAPDDATSPLHKLERRLHPAVAYAIVPLFGFMNAGVDLRAVDFAALSAVTVAIAAGLVVGKTAGIFGSVWLAVRLRLTDMPADAEWGHVLGVAILCGIGFTMSLFIGGLAFGEGSAMEDGVKIGVLAGSVVAAILGYAVLRLTPRSSMSASGRA